MRIGIIVLAAIIGVISWLKPESPKKWIAYTCVGIILAMAILEIVHYINERKDKARNQITGELHPESKILVSSDLSSLPKIEIADIGSTIEIGNGVNKDFFYKLLKDSDFKLETEKGEIKITLLIRDRTGRVVARIDRNEWKLNSNNYFDRNYSKNALEIVDSFGDIILQIRLIEDKIQLQGKFYRSDGSGIEIGKFGENINYPGGIHNLGPETVSILKIEPIFVYPSNQHLGELRKKQ